MHRCFAAAMLATATIGVCLAGSAERFHQVDYEGFTVWLDCTNHGAVAFRYELTEDRRNYGRSDDFRIDSSVPGACQPTSAASYRTDAVPVEEVGTFDRGHLVPANHMDNSRRALEDTFYVTNILPQSSDFNQEGGA